MVKDGIPFVLVPVVVGLILLYFGLWPLVIVFFGLAAFMAYFFRDPRREIPQTAGLIVSAADGRVTRIEDTPERKVVSVFLSPLDVHINRSPIAGTVKKITYTIGKKAPATSDESSLLNERNSLIVEGEGITITCTQIAGIVARRIVCWPHEGDNLGRGEKFGLIKFGSRTDLVMPPTVELKVKIGDRVVGGETVIATHIP
jgi:phosphatidylserine decarboxylase